MEDKINLFRELQANNDVLNSSSVPNEKTDAVRKQAILLDQISESFSEVERFSIYRSFLRNQDIDDEYSTAYLLERSKNVEEMLRELPRTSAGIELYVEGLLLNKNVEDSGKYKTNVVDEVSPKDLQLFREILGRVPSSQLLEPSKREERRFSGASTEFESEYDNGRQTTLNRFLFKRPSEEDSSRPSGSSGFRTAREEMIIQNLKKTDSTGGSSTSRALFNYGAAKKSLGARRNVRSEFVPPIRPEDKIVSPTDPIQKTIDSAATDERLRNIEPKMIELITNEIMHKYKPISWDDIAGLEYSKSTIKEAVVWPLLRPDIFTGLRRPPRGILLFGPPGTGKTLIGKCIASQSKSTFFSISASSLTSKWVGDGEKMVRALFAVAAFHQPSVVFIDEIDSLLSQRSETEHESTRRLKNEFLVQLDGASTSEDERILVVAATNRPQELDEAARRRLTRRLYIPLPELAARIQILTKLLQSVRNQLTEEQLAEIGQSTEGYSGADVETLCREASMEPIRTIPAEEIPYFEVENLRPVAIEDFHSALVRVRPSVSRADLRQYEDWNRAFGAGQ